MLAGDVAEVPTTLIAVFLLEFKMEIEDCRWTQVPNDFIDKGGIRLCGSSASCIYWCILRKTRGFHRETEAISYSQLHELTHYGTATISKAIKCLLENNLIEAVKEDRKTTKYRPVFIQTTSETEAGYFRNESRTTSETEETKETLKESIKDNKNGEAVKVLEYVNEIGGKSYQPIDGNLKHIRARLREGYTELRLREVAWFIYDIQGVDDYWWKKNLQKFFRPSTLYNSEKFPNYLEELKDYEAIHDR